MDQPSATRGAHPDPRRGAHTSQAWMQRSGRRGRWRTSSRRGRGLWGRWGQRPQAEGPHSHSMASSPGALAGGPALPLHLSSPSFRTTGLVSVLSLPFGGFPWCRHGYPARWGLFSLLTRQMAMRGSLLPACSSVPPAGQLPGPWRLEVLAGGQGPDMGPKLGAQESHARADSSPGVSGDPLRSGSCMQTGSPETTRRSRDSALDPGVLGMVTGTMSRVQACTLHLGSWCSVRQQVSPKEGGWRASTVPGTQMKQQSLKAGRT